MLVVLTEDDENVWRSLRNLDHVHCILGRELNAYDVLVNDHIVFTRETLDFLVAKSRSEHGIDTAAPAVPASAPRAQQVAAAEDAAGIVDPQAAALAQADDAPAASDDAAESDEA